MKTSKHLTIGEIFTRKDLKAMFKIADANLNNGVFRPKGHDSIWIFVKKEKSADRTQYLLIDARLYANPNHKIAPE